MSAFSRFADTIRSMPKLGSDDHLPTSLRLTSSGALGSV